MPRAWRPILDRDLAEEARQRAGSVLAQLESNWQASFSRGEWGLPLLRVYHGFAEGRPQQAALAAESAADAAAEVLALCTNPWLYSRGWAGTAWLIAHLNRITRAEPFDHAEIEEALAAFLCRRPWRDQYDLVSGYVGIAVYLLESQRPLSRTAVECIDLILEHIWALREEVDEGTTWHTQPALLPDWQRRRAPYGYYNLGVAHGIPGILWTLARCNRLGLGTSRSSTMLEGGVNWLLGQRSPDGLFPSWFYPGSETRPPGFSWCYGGLGLCTVLVSIALDTSSADLLKTATHIGSLEAERSTNPADAGLCHGKGGVAHLFNRLYQHTGAEVFLAAARKWFLRALESVPNTGGGIGGYMSWTSEAQEPAEFHWAVDPSFLTGASGTALALLAAACAQEPEWDAVLLMPRLLQHEGGLQ